MASIVLGLGASHTPLLTLSSEQWAHRAEADYANPRLNLSDGRWLSYAELLAEVGPRYGEQISAEQLKRKAELCDAALDHLADALEAAQPDVVLIVGDDQTELFSAANQPAFAVFHGETMVMLDKFSSEGTPTWMQQMGRAYLMDQKHSLATAPDMARSLIEGLMDLDIDVASVVGLQNPKGSGFGHAFGFIVQRLFRGRAIPVLPVLLNTYYPPNVPTARRCYDLGQAVAKVLQGLASDQRVAIVASGGLSHFVVDEALDRRVLKAMVEGNAAALRAIPRPALHSGSSEILNWVLAAGALAGLSVSWHEYQALYRTPAGTGVGAAFCIWR
jgi:Catalytic LigB subunit of aromatic ring-opening dioxygenase